MTKCELTAIGRPDVCNPPTPHANLVYRPNKHNKKNHKKNATPMAEHSSVLPGAGGALPSAFSNHSYLAWRGENDII